MDTSCPFCSPASGQVIQIGVHAMALWDAFPVSPGHALIVPKRHIPDWFSASCEEQHEILSMIDMVRMVIEENYDPDGYNIGINSGAAAGQTVFHLHLHLIPRYLGDVADPRGGIRHVIAHKASYWTKP